ncbi:hypothetical protein LBMAG18_13610 [Alphaproteobacteria bacterium]|nr:hypothetical protein LBMAG18_13610 [Alphaproteobacteria bacterium]
MESKSIHQSSDQQSSEKLDKYFTVLKILRIDKNLASHIPSQQLLGFFESVTAKGVVADNNELGQEHIKKAIRTYAHDQDIAVTEFNISGSGTLCREIDKTITDKMKNPNIKSASHVIEMGGHWMALTFKKQINASGQVINDDKGNPKITAFLADSLPETPANAEETSFDRNRELLQGYLMSFNVDFQRVKVATQGTEQCGENAVANVLAMQNASYQDLQKHQYDLSQSSLSTQVDIPILPVEIAPAQIRKELKSAFNNEAKAILEQEIANDIPGSTSLTSGFSPSSDVAKSSPPMEVRGDGLLGGGLRFKIPSLLDSLRRESTAIRKDYPLLGYLEQLQTNLALKNSLKDVAGQTTTELEIFNQKRQKLLSNLSETLKSLINQSSGLEEKKYTNQFLNNLKSPTVANNLEKFLPLIEDVVRDPRKINDQITQSKMKQTIDLFESHEKLQQNFNLYQNFTLDQVLKGKAFPEIRLSRIKDQLINYLQIDKQLNSGGNPSLDKQTNEFIDKVFTHEPSKTNDKLPFILKLVKQPQSVYDPKFKQEYNHLFDHQSIPNPAISSSDVKEHLKGLRREISNRIENQRENPSSPDIQQKFQELWWGFFSLYSDQISRLTDEGKSFVDHVFSGQDIRKKLDFIGELILDPKKANDPQFIDVYHQQVHGGKEGQIRSGGGVGNRDHRNQEVWSSEIQFSGSSFGFNPYGSDKVGGLGVSISKARDFPEEVKSVVDILQGRDKQTPSPSPRPVSCFNFNQFLKSIFGGKSQTTHQGVKSSDLFERGFGRLFGRSKDSGQSGGR